MIRNLIFLTLIFNLSFIFSQKNIVNVDSIIKVDNYKVFKNISYGTDKKNKLDLWIASTELKTPFVVYVHGGGFGSSNKNAAIPRIILKELKAY